VRCAGPALRGEACTSEAWYCRASAPHTPVTTTIIITIKPPSVAALGSGFALLVEAQRQSRSGHNNSVAETVWRDRAGPRRPRRPRPACSARPTPPCTRCAARARWASRRCRPRVAAAPAHRRPPHARRRGRARGCPRRPAPRRPLTRVTAGAPLPRLLRRPEPWCRAHGRRRRCRVRRRWCACSG